MLLLSTTTDFKSLFVELMAEDIQFLIVPEWLKSVALVANVLQYFWYIGWSVKISFDL